MSNTTYFLITNFWGSSKSYTKRVNGLAAAVEAFNAMRTRNGVRSCVVSMDADGNGMIASHGVR